MDTPQICSLPVSQIVAGENDRTVFEINALTELAESIRDHGLAQPITVRPIADDKFEIVAGERRFRAVSVVLKWTHIHAIIRHLSDEEASAIMLIENVNRVDLNPIDEARSYRKRIDKFGWSKALIAEKANVNPKRVVSRLKLLDLADEIQDMVKTYQLGLAFAECMSPLDHNRQRIAMRYIINTDRPSLAIFRQIVGRLLEQQLQESMFTSIWSTCVQAEEEHLDAIRSKRYPIDDRLPEFKRVKNVAVSLETYIAELLKSGDPIQVAAASVVGRVYQGMVTSGLCYPPEEGPIDALNYQAV